MLNKCSIFIFMILSVFCHCESLIDYDHRPINEFVVKILGGFSEAISVAKQTGFSVTHKMMGFDDLYVFKYTRKGDDVPKFQQHRVRRSIKVVHFEQQIARKRVKRTIFSNLKSYKFVDPLYKNQWYLMRSQNNPEQYDMNVLEAWNLGFTGRGVVVSILDDGIDYRHSDLKDNYDPKASYDINGQDSDPLPNYLIRDNRHGTRCAGEVAAKANNNKCGVGIAYNSKIGGIRMLDGEVTDRVEAEALSLNIQHIDIFSGSWGPDDNGQKVEGPSRFAKAAIERGITKGRGGLGNIYVWASGNGGKKEDSCACDGYASSIYTLSVSSLSERNLKPWYLESCASTLISTYSSGGIDEQQIISTDLNNYCATDHTGTSASAPIAAGIIALVLEANRNLTWRDIQYLAVVTANTLPFLEKDFIINGANRKVSNLYGFGLMDAGKMVRLGQLWQTLPPQQICKFNSKSINKKLSGVFRETETLVVNGCTNNNVVNYVEHVVLYISMEYQKRGDLRIFLVSPSNTISEILPYRKYDTHSGNTTFDKWPLVSVQFWGELSSGKWTVVIENLKNNNAIMKGIIQSFSLEIYGTDKSPMRLNPPEKNDDDNWFRQFENFVVPHFNESEFKLNKDIINLTNSSETANFKCHFVDNNSTCNGFNSNASICNICLPGTYLQPSNKTCQACHYSCDKCKGEGKHKCSHCHVYDSFDEVNNICRIVQNRCPKEFYRGLTGCVKCQSNCSVCTSSFHCSQCINGTVLTLNRLCKSKCDLGSYPDNRGRCHVCHLDCLDCLNGNPNECTSCPKGSFMLPLFNDKSYGKCIQRCDPGYFTNYTTGICYKCNENCKTCSGPSFNQCTDCIHPLEMLKTSRSCIDPSSYNCKPDEFKTTKGVCKMCSKHCKSCVDDRCASCHSGRLLYNNTCVHTCPKDHFSITEDNICLSCRTFCDPCIDDVKLSQCSQCLFINKTCSIKCKEGNYWNNNLKSCSSCHSSCSLCDGGSFDNCTQCADFDSFLLSNQCFKSCPAKHYRYSLRNNSICVACHSSCKMSACDPINGKCLECPDGYLLSGGKCERIITCPFHMFWNINESSCQLCNQSCRSCSHNYNCTSCHKHYCLHPNHGTCHSCCSPFCKMKDCFQCIAGREFCKIFNSEVYPLEHTFFQNPGLVIFLVLVSAIFFYALMMVGFYKVEMIEILNTYFIKRSFKYSIVKVDELEEENDDVCKKKTSYLSLSTIFTSNDNSGHYNSINNSDSGL